MLRKIWLFLFLVALCPGLASGQGDITVECEGYGVNRDDALLAAKREAVQQGIGTLLISETEVENFALKRDMVLSRTIGAVRSYEVLSERKEGMTHIVRIRAVVSEAQIRHDLAALKILLESMDKPRLMVLVKEEDGRSAENGLVDYLLEKGFTVLDAATMAALRAKEPALVQAALGGDVLAAAQLASGNEADFVLLGRLKTSVMKSQLLEGAGMISGQAALSVRVVNAATGVVLASKSATAGAAHVSAETAQEVAAGKVAAKLMDRELFEQLIAAFQDMVNNGRPLEVTFRNVGDFQSQQAISKVVSGLADVSLQRRNFSDGQLILSLFYMGNVDSFCTRLDGKMVQGKRLTIKEIVGSRVVVVLQ